MFFAEVRPFEEIFRQGEQAGSEEQQEQSQQASQNAQEAEQVAEEQKQLIAATWKVIRRETYKTPTTEFVPDVRLLSQTQSELKEKATGLEEKVTDPRSKQFLQNALKNMDKAAEALTTAADEGNLQKLNTALSAEQGAYQDLLKLRAREHEVVRSNSRQRSQQSASSSSSRRQRQLDQLKLDEQQENQYQQQRTAQQQQQQETEQRETRQVLSRLRELAQRQEDLNRQMKELQSALAAAEDEAKKEELKRQLARLRDQQQEMLRDTDQLRDRMEQPENQERMADAKQQLDQTREDIRKASESLEQSQAQEASAAGARASEKLNELKENFRRAAAGQFGEAVEQIRDQARALDQKQQELSDQIAELNGQKPSPRNADPAGESRSPGEARADAKAKAPSLRGDGDQVDRQQVADDLQQQGQKLEELLEEMRKTVEEAEAAEPLLSKQLYDTVRTTRQERTDEVIDVARQLVDRGFLNEAQRAGDEASKSVTRLREGVEKAANGVLGDETEALRRARAELDALSQQLDRELGQAGLPPTATRNGGPSTRPSELASGDDPSGRGQAGGPATNPSDPQLAGADPRQSGDLSQAGERSRGGERQRGQEQTAQGEPSDQQQGQQASGQPQQGQPQAGQGEQPDQGEQPGAGQQQASGQPSQQGQQPGQGSPGQQGQPGQRGQPGQPGQQGMAQGDPSGQPGGPGQPGQPQPGESQQPGQGGQAQGGQPSDAQADAGSPGGRQPGQRQAGLRDGGGLRRGGNPNGRGGLANPGPVNEQAAGPFTGDNFREWSDRLRDIEEMVGDPELRAEAARIRERAKSIKADTDRHSKQPNWDLVRMNIGEPMAELRDAITEELLRREGTEALVPIDREAVPPEYAEQVRRYYERLGSGR